jgi:hypothetical protein
MSPDIFFINSLISPCPGTYQRSSHDLARSKYQRLIRPCLAFSTAKKTAKRWATFSGPIQDTNQGKKVGERGMERFAALHSFGQVPAARNLDAKRRDMHPEVPVLLGSGCHG